MDAPIRAAFVRLPACITGATSSGPSTFGTASVGVNSLILDGLAGADNFRLDAALVIPVTIHGGEGSDTITGPDEGMAWSITGADAGTADHITLFDGVETLIGRNGDDRFTIVAGGSISGQIDGGNGDDQLIAPDTTNSWSLSGVDAGALDVGAARGFANFAGIEQVTGGSGADEFRLLTAESISAEIDGSAGTDTLIDHHQQPDLQNSRRGGDSRRDDFNRQRCHWG